MFCVQRTVPAYLAVCGGDHVDVVADQLEREAPVHEGEASLQRSQTETEMQTVAADQTRHPLTWRSRCRSF